MSLSFKVEKTDKSGRTQLIFTQECESETQKPLVIRGTLEGIYIDDTLLATPHDCNEFLRAMGKAGELHLALKKSMRDKIMGKP